MILRRLFLALAVILSVALPANATSTTLVTPGPPLPMTSLATFLNNSFLTLGSCFSGSSAPSASPAPITYQCWMDTTTNPSVLKIYDGASWVQLYSINTSTHVISIPNSAIAAMATNTVKGNATSGSAVPTDLAVGTCSTSASALIWTTNTGFGCNTSINAATLGGATFSAPGAIGGGTPSTGAFTTLTASTSARSPIFIGGTGTTGTQSTFQTTTGNGTTDAFVWNRGNNGATLAMTLNNTGLGIGTAAPAALLSVNANTVAAPTPAALGASSFVTQLVGANSVNNRLAMYGSAALSAINFFHSQGTLASPTATQNGNNIGSFGAYGYGTNQYVTGASAGFLFAATENYTNTAAGSRVYVITTPNTTATAAVAATFFESGGLSIGDLTDPGIGVIRALNGFIIGTAAKTLVLKQGANGAVGTFVCTGGGTITITNSFVAIADNIIISLNTVGGTITTAPAMKAITAATSFQVLCGATDTSTYNYAILKNAA